MNVMVRSVAATLGKLGLSLLLGAAGLAAGSDPPQRPAKTGQTNETGFGPAREGVLPGSAPCRMHYVQFHTGAIIAIGDGPGDTSDHEEAYRRAEESGGLDASVIGGPDGFQLAGRGCIFTRERSPKWETLTADEVVRMLRTESWLYGVVEIEKKDFPATYLFKTARGECGLLQILGASDDARGWNGHGMKYRCKLVQAPSKAASIR
jgi:hypothetical protein